MMQAMLCKKTILRRSMIKSNWFSKGLEGIQNHLTSVYASINPHLGKLSVSGDYLVLWQLLVVGNGWSWQTSLFIFHISIIYTHFRVTGIRWSPSHKRPHTSFSFFLFFLFFFIWFEGALDLKRHRIEKGSRWRDDPPITPMRYHRHLNSLLWEI